MKTKNLLPQIIEPFAIVALLCLFIVPTLTVINLSPITKEVQDKNVLGVNTFSSNTVVKLVGGTHDIIKNETLINSNERQFLYKATIQKREAEETYSKPILKLQNNGTFPVKLSLFGYTDSKTNSKISLKIGRNSYLLKDYDSTLHAQEIILEPTSDTNLYLYIENTNRILFPEYFELEISL